MIMIKNSLVIMIKNSQKINNEVMILKVSNNSQKSKSNYVFSRSLVLDKNLGFHSDNIMNTFFQHTLNLWPHKSQLVFQSWFQVMSSSLITSAFGHILYHSCSFMPSTSNSSYPVPFLNERKLTLVIKRHGIHFTGLDMLICSVTIYLIMRKTMVNPLTHWFTQEAS